MYFSKKMLFIAVILLSGSLFAQTITITSSATTGDPGDKITFNYSVSGNGIKSKAVMMDGVEFTWGSTYTWAAIPGTHIFYIRVILDSGEPMKEKYIAVEISGIDPSFKFKHPGIFNSQTEFDEIRKNVNGSAPHPMKQGWTNMLNLESGKETGSVKYSSLSWQPHASKIVNPKKEQKMEFMNDMRAVYSHSLQWVVKGNQANADKAIEILNAWSAVYEGMECYDYYKQLYGSWMGHLVVAGAEILAHYKRDGKSSGWKDADIKRYKEVVAYDLKINSLTWLGSKGYYNGHNQPAAIAKSRLALGVFLDDKGLFNSGLNLLFDHIYDHKQEIMDIHGHWVNLVGLCIAKTGEIMEFNRGGGDAAHGTGTLNALSNAAEILRHQDVEEKYRFYDYLVTEDKDKAPRLLLGAEFAANSYIYSPNTKIMVNNAFKNTTVGRYAEFVLNYYKHISPIKYGYLLTDEANELFRKNEKIGYTVPWTILTHADLSKDLSVAATPKDIKTKKMNITLNINKNKILTFGYGDAKNATVKLFTPAGRVVKKVVLNGAKEVSLKNLNHGLYLVKFTADGISETKKLLIK